MKRSFFAVSASGPSLGYVQSGSGPVAVFQHGLGADANQPIEVFPQDAGLSLVTLECRGHAQSELGCADEVSIATFARDLERLVDRLDLPHYIVGGISLGAAVALRFAATRPERVRALILARPAWVTATAPDNLAVFGEIAQLMTEYGAEEAKTRFRQGSTFAAISSFSPDNASSLLGQFDAPDLSVRAILLQRVSRDGPGISESRLASLHVPTLVIGNGMDAIHPVAYAEALAGIIPRARFVEITPKSISREGYVADFRAALRTFISECTR